jgi:hypothetical protein
MRSIPGVKTGNPDLGNFTPLSSDRCHHCGANLKKFEEGDESPLASKATQKNS